MTASLLSDVQILSSLINDFDLTFDGFFSCVVFTSQSFDFCFGFDLDAETPLNIKFLSIFFI